MKNRDVSSVDEFGILQHAEPEELEDDSDDHYDGIYDEANFSQSVPTPRVVVAAAISKKKKKNEEGEEEGDEDNDNEEDIEEEEEEEEEEDQHVNDNDEDEEDEDEPARLGLVGSSTDRSSHTSESVLMAKWRKSVISRREAGPTRNLVLEVTVERGIGGSKYVLLRSAVSISNSTCVPIAMRALPMRPYASSSSSSTLLTEDALNKSEYATGLLAKAMRFEAKTKALEKIRALQATAAESLLDAQRKSAAAAAAADSSVDRKSSVLKGADAVALFGAGGRVEALRSAAAAAADFAQKAKAAVTIAASTPLPESFSIPCWDAAAAGIPIDRVVLPGQSWRLPVPYSSNCRILVRPAIKVPGFLAGGNKLLQSGNESDDGRAIIVVPVSSIDENEFKDTLLSAGTSVNGRIGRGHHKNKATDATSTLEMNALVEEEEEEEDDDDDESYQTKKKKKKTGALNSSATNSNNLDEIDSDDDMNDTDAFHRTSDDEDDDMNSSDEDEVIGEEEEEEQEEEDFSYIPDPRHDWSQFENSNAAQNEPDVPVFQDVSSTASSSSSFKDRIALSRDATKKKRSTSSTISTALGSSSSEALPSSIAAGNCVGLDLDAISSRSMKLILSKLLGKSGSGHYRGRVSSNLFLSAIESSGLPSSSSGATLESKNGKEDEEEEEEEEDDEDEEDDDDDDEIRDDRHALTSSSIAVCQRSRSTAFDSGSITSDEKKHHQNQGGGKVAIGGALSLAYFYVAARV